MTRHELVVDGRDAGQRLDAWVAAAGIALSRSRARHLIDAGAVRVGGAVRKAGYAVRAGDRVEVEVPPPPAPRAEPEDLPLQVLYEDASLVAINKAPGMVVHPAPGRWQGTLVNALLHRWGPLPADDVRPGIVHRLDRDTSGVMVIARTPAALEHLARQFRDRTVVKRYLAVVRGVLRRDALVIDAAIGRHPTERKKMSTRAPRGRAAVTHVRVLERFAAATLVEASPHTGRTHQIRVHLAAQGFPILGDAVYGGGAVAARNVGKRAPLSKVLPMIARQALHAASLEVTHPERGDRLRFDAPLWADMEQLISALRTASL
jgi:23S rRNA pseudouridine1911/1915/1917 synthase